MRNKIDPAKHIGLVCSGGRIGNERNKDAPGLYQTCQTCQMVRAVLWRKALGR